MPVERIAQRILYLRNQKLMLDSDLARLYGVTTGNLNKAVNRNRGRFPLDFMFQLSAEEAERLIFQFGISKGRGGRRHLPHAFTEQGVAMLSSVLNSERAVKVNIAIMRAFVRLREVLEAIRQLMAPPQKPHREIGFHVREKAPRYRAIGRVSTLR
jgi:hypothetical protein